MKIKRLILLSSLLVVSLSSVFAGEDDWTDRIYHTQPVTAQESIAGAKILAIDAIRQKAALQAGAVVIKTETLKDDSYSAITQVVGVTIVKLSEISETVMQKDGLVYIEVAATASVDLSLIKEKIDYLVENRALAEQLSKLQERYLLSQLDKDLGQDSKVHLIKATQNGFKRWISAYELKGSAGVTNAKVARAEATILNSVLLEVAQNGVVHSFVEVIEKDDYFQIYVNIDFDYDDQAVEKALSIFWQTRNRHNAALPYLLAIGDRKSSTEYTPLEYRRIFEYLSSYEISVEINVLGQKKSVPISYLGNGFTPGCVINDTYKTSTNYCISKLRVDQPYNTRHYQSPLMFTIDKDDIESPANVAVKGQVVLGRI